MSETNTIQSSKKSLGRFVITKPALFLMLVISAVGVLGTVHVLVLAGMQLAALAQDKYFPLCAWGAAACLIGLNCLTAITAYLVGRKNALGKSEAGAT